jgi:hypothetical protein
MRGVFIQQPFEFRLEVQGEMFVQGSSVPCTLTAKNHGDSVATLDAPKLILTLANLKKIKAKDVSGFEAIIAPELERGVEIGAKSDYAFKHTFELDINSAITDKGQSPYVLYGSSSDVAGLGQLMLTVSPHPHLRSIFDTMTSMFSFVAKGETWKDGWTSARFKPPESRRMSFVDELALSARHTAEALELRFVFSVKKFDTSMTKVDVKKGKAEVRQSWPRAEYLFGGDFLNQEYAEKMIDSALAEVSSGL